MKILFLVLITLGSSVPVLAHDEHTVQVLSHPWHHFHGPLEMGLLAILSVVVIRLVKKRRV